MTSGLLYALAALVSFGTLGVFHKLADVKKCRPTAINALLYVWSFGFVFLFALASGNGIAAPSGVVGTAIPFGISASVAILALQAGIRHGNIATSWLAINLSAGIPTVASILIYGEAVTPYKAVALSLIPVSMYLLWRDKKADERRQAEPPGPPGEPS